MPRASSPAAIDAHTRLYALLADPVDHVRAPLVWTTLFNRYRINAVMLPAHVAPAAFAAAVDGLKALANLDGLMLTMPHKQAGLRHVARITGRARQVGAINLMRREPDGSWSGDNVDGAGFIAGLTADHISLHGVDAYVHGTGGVGQAIAWSLAAEPIASLTLFDIDTARAARLAAAIRDETGVAVQVGAGDHARHDLMINASPAGLHAGDPLPFPVSALPVTAVVCDVIMEPMLTPLLVAAGQRGLRTHHGRHMMNYGMPLAAGFYRLDTSFDWNGGPVQNAG